MIMLAIIGICLFYSTGVRLYPQIHRPRIIIMVSAPGRSPSEIESALVSRMEGAVSRVQGVKEIRSVSSYGSGIVTVEFDKRVDMDFARFEVSSAIRDIWDYIHSDIQFPVIKVDQGSDNIESDFMVVTVGMHDDAALRDAITTKIVPALSIIDGVGDVTASGIESNDNMIVFDRKMCERYGISLSDIAKAIDRNTTQTNIVYNEGCKRSVLSIYNPVNLQSLAGVRVTGSNGSSIEINKLFSHRQNNITYGDQRFRLNGVQAATIRISTESGANQFTVSHNIRQCLNEYIVTLPEGLSYTVNYDATIEMRSSLSGIILRTLLTLLILLCFVWISMHSWKVVIIISVGTIVTLALTGGVLYLMRIDVHLYSIAGLTISLNLLLDNLIVASDYYTACRNRRFFTAIFAATATTIGSLSIVLFLNEDIKTDLIDFVYVVIISMCCSLVVAFFMIPSLVAVIGSPSPHDHTIRLKYLWYTYRRTVDFACHHRILLFAFTIWSFGLPVFLLPMEVGGEGKVVDFYNGYYRYRIRPITDRLLGGSLFVFCNDIIEYHGKRGSISDNLTIRLLMPENTVTDRTDRVVEIIEDYLSKFSFIESFTTSVTGNMAIVNVEFSPAYRKSHQAKMLKEKVKTLVSSIGSGNWMVSGVDDDNYYDDPRINAGSFAVKLTGPDYSELFNLSTIFIDSIKKHPRVNSVTLSSEEAKFVFVRHEPFIALDMEAIELAGIKTSALRQTDAFTDEISMSLPDGNRMRLLMEGDSQDRWHLMNKMFRLPDSDKRASKMSAVGNLLWRNAPATIIRENRRYVLIVQFDYNGSEDRGSAYIDEDISCFRRQLPDGYTIERINIRKNYAQNSSEPYIALCVIIMVIFFISAILFDSMRLPLYIIIPIPISFIGAFLAFGYSSIRFNSGGFAALVLLCGLTVNASIYIVNQYTINRASGKFHDQEEALISAIMSKSRAIMLTVASTILGFTPFIMFQDESEFWKTLASGVIGGLITSLFAIYILLPVLILNKKQLK